MQRIFLTFNLFLIVLTAAPTLAFAAQDSQAYQDILFEQGSASFRAGDYKKGLELFLQAQAQGLDKISLSYNIGVCAYKLGDYAQARKAFLDVSREPDMAALAYYNLGLIDLQENDRSAAENRFNQTIGTTTDAKLKKVAEVALARLNPQTKPVWFGFASLGGGYDDNVKIVTDTATLTTTGLGDGFSEFLAMARGPVFSPNSPFNLQLTGYYLNYLKEDEYDYSALALKLFHKGSIQSWQSETGADYSYAFLDTKQYSRIPSVFMELRKEFSTGMFFRAKDSLSYLDMLAADYESFTGTRNRLLLETGRKWRRNRASIEYVLELNNRDNPDESPTRNSMKLKLNSRPGQQTSLYTSIGYRQSNYEITGAADRDEDLVSATLRLAYNVSQDWILAAEYNYEDNQSDDSTYEYTRNVVLVNVTRNF